MKETADYEDWDQHGNSVTEMQEAETIHHDEDLMVRRMPGHSDRLILAFSGVDHRLGGMPFDEFIGTASRNSANHVLFVSDMQRSWYSKPGLVSRITEVVTRYCQENGIKTIDSVGNSMGAYGAIRFSSELPVSNVAAFAPQISMHPDVITENRWSKYHDGLAEELLPSLAEPILNSKAQIFLTAGGDCVLEQAQMTLLPDAPNLHVRKLPFCYHNVVRSVKEAGFLPDLIDAKLSGDLAQVNGICDAFEKYNRQLPRVLARLRGKIMKRVRRISGAGLPTH